jgi:hypothetical protein
MSVETNIRAQKSGFSGTLAQTREEVAEREEL